MAFVPSLYLNPYGGREPPRSCPLGPSGACSGTSSRLFWPARILRAGRGCDPLAPLLESRLPCRSENALCNRLPQTPGGASSDRRAYELSYRGPAPGPVWLPPQPQGPSRGPYLASPGCTALSGVLHSSRTSYPYGYRML